MRGRYAPSPTGAMHLGNARTALLAWLDARAAGGAFVMRVEDLDRARIVAGAEERLLADLRWLGLDWDEGPDLAGGGGPFGPYRQSERTRFYDEAVDRLLAAGAAFPCACSRADVARAATAPHAADDDEPRYPGTCRALPAGEVAARAAAHGREPSIRFAGAAAGDAAVDDFVLRRADGVAAYQLAVVVDDIAMRITRVVRGDDLLRSTPRQLALYRALGASPPAFVHVPLVLAPGGERLAKRTRPPSIASLREHGVAPPAIVGALAASAGLEPPGAHVAAADLIASFDWARVPSTPVTLDEGALVSMRSD
jgi:glutamyl-tRNA synthetase